MREKFNALLLKKRFKSSELKAAVKLAISRLAVLKSQRQARCSIARSDVVELLNMGKNERALFRVEKVIKEQNMLDVYDSLEGYCHLLIERIDLIEEETVCPEELKEALSSLIYATTRCGEFPELQEIRTILASRFGKEFAARAAELRNNCGVNVNIIQKLATRMPNMENKVKVLKDIASDHNIVLQIEETLSPTSVAQEEERGEEFSNSVNMRRKYRDVAHAAQAAFESASYAAVAARAAVELSRSESTDPDDPSSPNLQSRKVEVKDREQVEHTKIDMKSDKIHPIMEHLKQNVNETEFKRRSSASSLDSKDEKLNEIKMSSDNAINDLDVHRKNDSTGVEPLNINRRPISVRSKWVRGFCQVCSYCSMRWYYITILSFVLYFVVKS